MAAPPPDDAPFERPPPPRRTRWAAGALALALAAGLTAGLALRSADRAPEAAPTPTAPALLPVGQDEADDRLLGTWTPLPEGPLTPRWGAQAVWTGSEAIVWGGYAGVPPDGDLDQDADPRTFPPDVLAALRPLRDGAAFDPASGTWRAIAGAPADVPPGAWSTWTGEELLVVGGRPWEPPGAWAYDPRSDTWRTLARGPLGAAHDALRVWTGSEALVWSGAAAPGEASVAMALDPSGGRWRTTTPGPPLGYDLVGTWAGRELLAWDAGSGIAYAADTDTWRELDDPPATMRPHGRMALPVGDDVLLAGAYPLLDVAAYGYRYRPSDQRWDVQPLPEPPDEQFPAISALAIGDEHAVVLHRYSRGPSGGEAFRWTRASGAWERLTPDPMLERLATAEVWTGEELLVWGGLERGEPRAGGAAWRP